MVVKDRFSRVAPQVASDVWCSFFSLPCVKYHTYFVFVDWLQFGVQGWIFWRKCAYTTRLRPLYSRSIVASVAWREWDPKVVFLKAPRELEITYAKLHLELLRRVSQFSSISNSIYQVWIFDEKWYPDEELLYFRFRPYYRIYPSIRRA